MNPKRKSTKNLKPWAKGCSGNPKGRPPKAKAFAETVRELLAADSITVSWSIGFQHKTLNLKTDASFYHVLAAVLINEGLKGNIQAVRELIDRTEGKAIQTTIETTPHDPVKSMSDEELDAEIKRLKSIVALQQASATA